MWIVLSLATMGLMATMLLFLIHLGRVGVEPSIVLLYLFAAGCAFNFVYLKVMGTPLHLSATAVPWILGAAAASFFGNLCGLMAMKLAPNPGYPVAIEGSKMVVVTLLSIWLFAAHFSAVKGLGALFCAIGVALICL
jgi:hypothetical protein